jgi:hypothetical protein
MKVSRVRFVSWGKQVMKKSSILAQKEMNLGTWTIMRLSMSPIKLFTSFISD